MSNFLTRLATEEAGTCMTDSRGMYGWVLAAGVTTYFVFGHRFPELITFVDRILPPANAYHVP